MNKEQLKACCRRNAVELLVLFGSTATGGARPGSDIDLAVKLRKGAAARKLELISQLGELFEDREIDLVVLTADTDPVLLFEIFSTGTPLYAEQPTLFAAERLRALKLYYDTEKLRMYRADYLRRFIERSRHVA